MRDHVVLCGTDVLAARVLEELGALGVDVAVIAQDPDRRLETRMRELGVVVIDGDYRDEETLHEADVADAEAVAGLEEDDVGNVHAALAAPAFAHAALSGNTPLPVRVRDRLLEVQ